MVWWTVLIILMDKFYNWKLHVICYTLYLQMRKTVYNCSVKCRVGSYATYIWRGSETWSIAARPSQTSAWRTGSRSHHRLSTHSWGFYFYIGNVDRVIPCRSMSKSRKDTGIVHFLRLGALLVSMRIWIQHLRVNADPDPGWPKI
jgi:hypothetical protein